MVLLKFLIFYSDIIKELSNINKGFGIVRKVRKQEIQNIIDCQQNQLVHLDTSQTCSSSMSYNKQNTQFFLPSLLNHQNKFEQLFYENHKFIVYDVDEKKQKQFIKPVSAAKRPKTGMSIGNILNVNARNKASIQKFITTHKMINQQRMKPVLNNMLKKKYDRSLIKASNITKIQSLQYSKNQANLEVHKNTPLIINQTNRQNLNLSPKVSLCLLPQNRLIQQIIKQHYNSKLDKLKSKSIQSITSLKRSKSVQHLFTQQSLNEQANTLSVSRKHQNVKQNLTIKPYDSKPLRKSISIKSQKIKDNQHSVNRSRSNFLTEAQSKKNKLTKIQPQIKIQNASLTNSNTVSQENSKKQLQNQRQLQQKLFEMLFNPIINFYGQKDTYKQYKQNDYLIETNPNYNIGTLPLECFISSQTSKRRTYIDSQVSRLQRKVKQQQKIIHQKQNQIQNILPLKQKETKENNGLNKQSNSLINNLQQQQTKKVKINTLQQQNLINRLSSIQQQQDHHLNPITQHNDLKNEQQKQKVLTQEIQILGKSLLQNKNKLKTKKYQSHQQSQLGLLSAAESIGKFSQLNRSQSKYFLTKKNSNIKNSLLNNRNKKKEQNLSFESSCLKRAGIVSKLNVQYYERVSDLYWKVVNQKPNAYLFNQQQNNHLSLQTYQKQSLKYIKQYHKNRSRIQSINDSRYQSTRMMTSQTHQSDQAIYVDHQFHHQSINFMNRETQQINWLYFKPSPQSALIPKEVMIPQHLLQVQSQNTTKHNLQFVPFLNCLLILNPQLIFRLFQPSISNVFSCWIFWNNQFQIVTVDGYLPYTQKLNSLYVWGEEYLWIGVLLKCVAKVMGNYDKMENLTFEDWATMIMGKGLVAIRKPTYQQLSSWIEEDQLDYRFKEYLSRVQKKYQSHMIIRNIKTSSFCLIKSIRNNKVRLTECSHQMRKFQIPIQELLVTDTDKYQFLLIPSSATDLHYTTCQHQSYLKGNIVSYQLEVVSSKSSLTISTSTSNIKSINQLNSSSAGKGFKKQKKNYNQNRRRILVYALPSAYSSCFNKKDNNSLNKNKNKKRNYKKQMILKYSSQVIPDQISLSNHENKSTLVDNNNQSLIIPQLKQGCYKIFIECGNINLNSYLKNNNGNKSVDRWIRTDQNEQINQNLSTHKNKKKQKVFKQDQVIQEMNEKHGKQNLPYYSSFNTNNNNILTNNIVTITSSHKITLKGGKNLVINQKTQQNQIIEDQQFTYFPVTKITNHRKERNEDQA